MIRVIDETGGHDHDDEVEGEPCPRCGGKIEYHQPDPDLSDRLLATCEDCKRWFLTDDRGNPLIRLPDVGTSWRLMRATASRPPLGSVRSVPRPAADAGQAAPATPPPPAAPRPTLRRPRPR